MDEKKDIDELLKKTSIRDEKLKEHENHLCYLARRREMAKIAKLAKGAQYMCLLCGRGAKDPKNLCMPYKI